MNNIKTIIKLIFSVVLCFGVVFAGNAVQAQENTNITFLGDSITTGFGLSEDELSYDDYIESYFEADIENYAVNGLTTAGLIEILDKQEVKDSISQSDMICVSIGGNDFLSIFQEAMTQAGDIGFTSDGQMNISSDFISKFVMDYSTAFSDASVKAGENIAVIKDTISEINPEAEIIMQTVYNPFESSNPELNGMMSPLKTFAAMYITTINNSITEICPNTADIYLKFSEKPYLYTNIDSYDIHPNYIGHLLIAEEIIQMSEKNGNTELFNESIYKIPQGVYSQFPEYMTSELDSFIKGELRRGTLSQSMERMASAEVTEEKITESETTEEITSGQTVSEQEETRNTEKKESGKTQKVFSRIFMVLGIALILAVTVRKFIRMRKK